MADDQYEPTWTQRAARCDYAAICNVAEGSLHDRAGPQ
jgi:hypothetical protein